MSRAFTVLVGLSCAFCNSDVSACDVDKISSCLFLSVIFFIGTKLKAKQRIR